MAHNQVARGRVGHASEVAYGEVVEMVIWAATPRNDGVKDGLERSGQLRGVSN
jgi:hypothetical protein